MTEPALSEHVDETGAPCPRHPAASPAALLQLAMVGSRAPAFHHDCASKLQGLLMALDELGELTENGTPELQRPIEAALHATRELNALLNINRALTKVAGRTRVVLRTLVTSAAERAGVRWNSGVVEARSDASASGTGPAGGAIANAPRGLDAEVSVTVASATHALALAIDVAAGAGRSRSMVIGAAVVDQPAPPFGGADNRGQAPVVAGAVELQLAAHTTAPANASESLAIASFALARDGGRLWCAEGGARIIVRLPLA